ncbi:MAG: 16S rRNA (guanine(527)-N(7))-methyltransferase RsmG [Bacteroidales bacterium]
MSDLVLKYFPHLDDNQVRQFSGLKDVYSYWNERINVISRKDFENFTVHHVLHSLSIAKIITFNKSTTIIDVGTGGGFPGIPLAIFFPECSFTLLDSIRKKIMVVSEVVKTLDIKNVNPVWSRVEDHPGRYDFIVSRAVTSLPAFVHMTRGKLSGASGNSLANGIIYLKGGDIEAETKPLAVRPTVWNISDFYDEPFFETKQIVHIPGVK